MAKESKAFVSNSFLLLLVRHLFLVALHLLLVAKEELFLPNEQSLGEQHPKTWTVTVGRSSNYSLFALRLFPCSKEWVDSRSSVTGRKTTDTVVGEFWVTLTCLVPSQMRVYNYLDPQTLNIVFLVRISHDQFLNK